MLTGRPAFDGDDVSDVLAAVLKTEPDFSTLPVITPQIRKLLRRCLAKNPKERWQAVGDVRFEIEDAVADPTGDSINTSKEKSRDWIWRAIAVTTLTVLAATLLLWSPWHPAPIPSGGPVRISGEVGANVSLDARTAGNIALALSPDGSTFAFVGRKDG